MLARMVWRKQSGRTGCPFRRQRRARPRCEVHCADRDRDLSELVVPVVILRPESGGILRDISTPENGASRSLLPPSDPGFASLQASLSPGATGTAKLLI